MDWLVEGKWNKCWLLSKSWVVILSGVFWCNLYNVVNILVVCFGWLGWFWKLVSGIFGVFVFSNNVDNGNVVMILWVFCVCL